MKKIDISFWLVAACSVGIALSRLLPHQPNWSPVLAICLLAGFFAKDRAFLMVMPLMAMAMADAFLGFYPGWGFNYIAYVGLVFIGGQWMKASMGHFLTSGLVGATLFFFVSNFGVWFLTGLYPQTLDGLILCFERALPFYRSSLAGTIPMMVIFYFAFRVLVENKLIQLAKNKA